MGKMHELLAVEASISGNLGRDRAETLHVLGKSENFRREVVTKTYFNAEDANLNAMTETALVTTVPDRIKWHMGFLSKYLDVQVQKDKTNQSAMADIVLEDGTVLLKDVPATTLLMLETKLGVDLRKIFETIPTLEAATKWEFNVGEGLFVTGPVSSIHTKKIMKPVILAPATEKHPAQVKESTEDVAIAKSERMIYSGMITSAMKAELLLKLDALVAAIKKARQRANQAEVVGINRFGETLTRWLISDLKLGG